MFRFSEPAVTKARFNTSSTLRLLLMAILRSKDGVVVPFGLVCSTFITISRGSTYRHYFLPEGDTSATSVAASNVLAARMIGLHRVVGKMSNTD